MGENLLSEDIYPELIKVSYKWMRKQRIFKQIYIYQSKLNNDEKVQEKKVTTIREIQTKPMLKCPQYISGMCEINDWQ